MSQKNVKKTKKMYKKAIKALAQQDYKNYMKNIKRTNRNWLLIISTSCIVAYISGIATMFVYSIVK